jgi:hypothetical protein
MDQMIARRLNPMRTLKWRSAVRIDVRRAVLMFSGVGGALMLAFFFAIHDFAIKPVAHGFGREWRTGMILFIPPSGDDCQRSVFDNDSGVIWPAGSISCMDATGETEKQSAPGHVVAISQNFRR